MTEQLQETGLATQYAENLRAVADWLETNDEVIGDSIHGDIGNLLIHAETAERMALLVKSLGRGQKSADTGYFNVTRQFGDFLSVEVWTSRDKVCKRVVKGTRLVTEERHDPEVLAALPLIEVTREEEIVEWECDESILSHLVEA